MDHPSRYAAHTIVKIPLVRFKGKLISESPDDVCYELEIHGNYFRKFFPKTMIWLNHDSIDVHEWLAERMGLLGKLKQNESKK